jgi:hypothetical protein
MENIMDKSEIEEMPTGMSSEEIDALTMEGEEDVTSDEDIEIAQKVVDGINDSDDSAEESVEGEEAEEAEEKDEEQSKEESDEKEKSEKEVDPKDAVIGEFRRKLRDQEIENARLQGAIEAMQTIGQKTEKAPVEKSPLQKAKEQYVEEYGSLDGFNITVDLYEAQETWKEEQVQKKAETERRTSLDQKATQIADTDYTAEKMGQGLDYRSIVIPGQRYLTEKHLQLIAATSAVEGTEAAIRKTYELCKDALLKAGGPRAEAIKLATQEKPKPKPKGSKPTQTKNEKRKTGMTSEEVDNLTTEGEESNKGEDELSHSQRLTAFMFNPE